MRIQFFFILKYRNLNKKRKENLWYRKGHNLMTQWGFKILSEQKMF